MRAGRFGVFQLILTLVAVFVLFRFLPMLIRLAQALAIGVRVYWWAVLPVLLCGWLIWKSKRRLRAAKMSEDFFERPPPRDVTNSINERSKNSDC